MTENRAEVVRRKLHRDLQTLITRGIDAVRPDQALLRHVSLNNDILTIDDDRIELRGRRVLLIAFGKAAVPMAAALESLLGDRLSDGVIITKYGHVGEYRSQRLRVFEAGHPIPDASGMQAAEAALALANSAGKQDIVLVAISGGGSALMVSPAPPLTLEEKQKTTALLLECGATIQEINTVRKHLSAVKGGRLAVAAAPASVYSLILSDVIGDPVGFIASGPTAPDTTTYSDALAILEKYRLVTRVPQAVQTLLHEGMYGRAPETPKPGERLFKNVRNIVIGNIAAALEAAAGAARELGYQTVVLTTALSGEAREVAHLFPAMAGDVLQRGWPVPPPACILAGGETTVTVRGRGKGGRNQELALAALPDLADKRVCVFASVGTDGTDGPTDAAGAVVDDTTLARATELGLNWQEYLQNNDAYHFFDRLGALLRTGPTQTNVMDMQILLVEPC